MEFNKTRKFLIAIFFVILLSRLYFIYQTPYLENDGYFVQRYVQNIMDTSKPIFYDTLSYNGRESLYSPIYYYILSFFGMLLGIETALKLIPSIFISSLVFIVYGLSKKINNNNNLSLFIALMSGFVPILFVETLINASIYTLVIPLTFYLLYLFIDIDKDKHSSKFVFFSLLLAAIHPSSMLFSLGLITYYLLSLSESSKISNLKNELIIFNVFSTFFIQFIIYKKAFLEYGLGVIWNNVPLQILSSYFDLSLLTLIYQVGALSLMFGLWGLITGIIKKRDKLLLFGGFILSILLLLWLRLIDSRIGLSFLSIALVVASTVALNDFSNYIQKTKISSYGIAFLIIIFLLLTTSLVVPSYYLASQRIDKDVPSAYDILVLDWVNKNSLPDVTILAPLGKGHIITAVAGKRNVMDNNFLFAPDSSQRYEDINNIYSTKSETEVLKLIQKYNIDYIFIPIETELEYGKVGWIDDTNCFEGIFFGTPKVYKVLC